MAHIENARCDAGALNAWRLFEAKPNTPRVFPQRAPRTRAPRFAPTTRGMLRDLTTAARAGRLTAWEANFVVSLQCQAARPHWRPSRRQAAVIRRLHTGLAEAEMTLIDDADITEFVGP